MSLIGKLFLCCFIFVTFNVSLSTLKSLDDTKSKEETLSKNKEEPEKPKSVDSRFFGLDNLFGSLFGSNGPNFNQGNFGGDNRGIQPAIFVQPPFNQQNPQGQGWNPENQNQGQGFPNQGQQRPFDQQNFGRPNNWNSGTQNRPNDGQFGQEQGQGQIPNQGAGFGNTPTFGLQRPGFQNNQNNQGQFNQGSGMDNQGSQRNPDSGFGNPGLGFGNQRPGFGNQGAGIGNQRPGFDNQGAGIGNQRPGFDNQGAGIGNQRPGFGNQGNPNLGFGYQSPGFGNQGSQENKKPGFENQSSGNAIPKWPNTQGSRPNWNDGVVNNPKIPNQDSTQNGESGNDFNNQGQDDYGDEDDEEPTAILGRPVVVSPATVPPDQITFNNASDSPAQIQCVQDCRTTSEYAPICGTNNVTYFNPARFKCARNCGINVFIQRQGRCDRP